MMDDTFREVQAKLQKEFENIQQELHALQTQDIELRRQLELNQKTRELRNQQRSYIRKAQEQLDFLIGEKQEQKDG